MALFSFREMTEKTACGTIVKSSIVRAREENASLVITYLPAYMLLRWVKKTAIRL